MGFRNASSLVRGGVPLNAIHARQALLPDGWKSDVRIEIVDGRIASLESGAAPQPADLPHRVLVPGTSNLHSHAFQRGMAGLAEVAGPAADTFWTWREVMYRFALSMTPDQMEAVASQAYVEMLEAGFTRVGEFHYLHHERDGSPYANIAEMASRIAAASARTSLRLTLLPVFYAHANFGGQPHLAEQRRFISNLAGFEKLLAASRNAIAALNGAVLGVAPHSLRAVTPDELAEVIALLPQGPIHIHAAEQDKEVDDCLAWSGKRPVAWLLDRADLNNRWCLIHATHMTDRETRRLAATGAVSGLCPITEANLGDGIFPAREFVDGGGQLGIGTDSNVRISVIEELRQLEYAQRLRLRQRNVLSGGGATGRALFESAYRGGLQALGVADAGIAIGAPADLVALATDLWEGEDGDGILDAWIFARGVAVDRVWVGGHQVVEGGRHVDRAAIASAYLSAMRELLADS